jgi:hypothetical protein
LVSASAPASAQLWVVVAVLSVRTWAVAGPSAPVLGAMFDSAEASPAGRLAALLVAACSEQLEAACGPACGAPPSPE